MKIIMLDGFKPQYFKHAPYLSALTKIYQWGHLEMPPGHWGGVECLYEGDSDLLAVFCKSRGSLKWVKYFSWLESFGSLGRFFIDSMINIIRLFKGEVLLRTGNIPLKRLADFDIVVGKALHKNKGVELKYFGELDGLGHKYGTKSKEMINAIKIIDDEVSKMDFDLIFSDHGMVDIKKKISVPWTDNCFIDADMARYWGNKKELDSVKKKLPMKEGKILNWKNKRFGDLIFLVNTGVLIYPNFWDKEGPSKAMHGYDGKHNEMKAIYILKQKGKRKDLKVKQLHRLIFK
jgi:hypothetical protein